MNLPEKHNLEIIRDGRLIRLALNRPERRNALDLALCRDLAAALREADADPGVGAMLLEGRGPVFCAGMDLHEVLSADPAVLAPAHVELFTTGPSLGKPLVAAVQGAALAGGVGLALNAHIVVAAADARFGLTELRLGLWPYTIFPVVAAAVGERRAVELALSARMLSATEAREIGLAHWIVPQPRLEETSLSLAKGLAQSSLTAITDGLGFVRRIRGLDPAAAGKVAIEYRRQAHHSPDFEEGVKAFREKRAPQWPSHDPDEWGK